MEKQRYILALTVCLSIFAASCVCAKDGNKHTTIVLFGATGDLSMKYLWQSIFNVYSHVKFPSVWDNDAKKQSNHSFNFIGVARTAQEKGIVLLNTKIQDKIECRDDLSESQSFASCDERKKSFITSLEYLQITNDSENFVKLCNQIVKGMPKIDVDVDIVMYMAISTTAYVSTIENFKKFCPENLLKSNVKIRWALEKPFGVNRMNAQAFADKLRTLFDEKDMYHVDHYLQKSVVKTMLAFRSLNTNLEKLWNQKNIERVEIYLKETLDVKDRVLFYNKMGVLRDIHQNHLTELLILIAMELPLDVEDTEEISERKADLLRHVESVKTRTSLFGQYADYAKHASLELANDTKTSDVPTFAATLVKVNSARWKGVPFLLVSGKHLDRRESFVRVVFKNNNVCVSQCQIEGSLRKPQPQVVFHIGHGDLSRPAILVSKLFGKPIWPDNILDVFPANNLFKTNIVHQTPVNEFFTGVIASDVPAYQSIVRDLVDGDGSDFVTTQRLILSWHVWDFIVTVNKSPKVYEEGDPHGDLNYSFHENYLEFLRSDTNSVKEKNKYTSLKADHTSIQDGHILETPARFLGRKLVTASASQLPSLLANTVAVAAKEEIKNKAVFHIAFSGGSSIAPVLHSLASLHNSLPWDSIHAWQVDERCVPHHHENSNFGLLDRELFRHVNIPFANIHTLPVDIAGDLCDESLGGAHLYTESVKKLVLNSQFDMVILGLGTDGHTASLFPQSTALHVDSDTFVTISEDGPHDTKRRMSLTLPLINRSKHIAVLVTGAHKREILKKLESSNSVDTYPILGVNPGNGTVSWYIDDLALSLVQ